ncbi:MAG: DUF1800 domain-containing protein [Pseudomonadota bacterium]
MTFSPDLAARRFAGGLSPYVPAPRDVAAMVEGLSRPDRMAERYPVTPYSTFQDMDVESITLRGVYKKNNGTPKGKEARAAFRQVLKDARDLMLQDQRAQIARYMDAADGMREELGIFWTDHFTTVRTGRVDQYTELSYAEDAIRPHITGRFADMLLAAAKHPRMLLFLNQNMSVGENSSLGKNGQKKRGINENLAREILELHTLGADGGYTQTDVRSFAKLLTGLNVGRDRRFVFNEHRSEPGRHTVLGVTYGRRNPGLEEIDAALNDIARHPQTARHLAWKLLVHFVSETPDPALMDQMAQAYLTADTQLLPMYEVMLRHASAWEDTGLGNVKWPVHYVYSAARALGLRGQDIMELPDGRLRSAFQDRVARMGQRLGRAVGPDGWEEADGYWITPQAVAQRISWAMTEPSKISETLPDPRAFVDMAVGSNAPDSLRFVASAAETQAEGVGLVLASPAFQRR